MVVALLSASKHLKKTKVQNAFNISSTNKLKWANEPLKDIINNNDNEPIPTNEEYSNYYVESAFSMLTGLDVEISKSDKSVLYGVLEKVTNKAEIHLLIEKRYQKDGESDIENVFEKVTIPFQEVLYCKAKDVDFDFGTVNTIVKEPEPEESCSQVIDEDTEQEQGNTEDLLTEKEEVSDKEETIEEEPILESEMKEELELPPGAVSDSNETHTDDLKTDITKVIEEEQNETPVKHVDQTGDVRDDDSGIGDEDFLPTPPRTAGGLTNEEQSAQSTSTDVSCSRENSINSDAESNCTSSNSGKTSRASSIASDSSSSRKRQRRRRKNKKKNNNNENSTPEKDTIETKQDVLVETATAKEPEVDDSTNELQRSVSADGFIKQDRGRQNNIQRSLSNNEQGHNNSQNARNQNQCRQNQQVPQQGTNQWKACNQDRRHGRNNSEHAQSKQKVGKQQKQQQQQQQPMQQQQQQQKQQSKPKTEKQSDDIQEETAPSPTTPTSPLVSNLLYSAVAMNKTSATDMSNQVKHDFTANQPSPNVGNEHYPPLMRADAKEFKSKSKKKFKEKPLPLAPNILSSTIKEEKESAETIENKVETNNTNVNELLDKTCSKEQTSSSEGTVTFLEPSAIRLNTMTTLINTTTTQPTVVESPALSGPHPHQSQPLPVQYYTPILLEDGTTLLVPCESMNPNLHPRFVPALQNDMPLQFGQQSPQKSAEVKTSEEVTKTPEEKESGDTEISENSEPKETATEEVKEKDEDLVASVASSTTESNVVSNSTNKDVTPNQPGGIPWGYYGSHGYPRTQYYMPNPHMYGPTGYLVQAQNEEDRDKRIYILALSQMLDYPPALKSKQ